MTFNDVGINLKGRTSGQVKVQCPQCSADRKKSKEPCLSVNIDEGVWNCKHCGWTGGLATTRIEKPVYVLPKFNHTELRDQVVKWFGQRKISQTTLQHFKITEEKMYMPHKGKEMNCVVFPYFRGTQCVNKKYRSADKGFRMVKDAELVFFNLNGIGKEDTIIAEGEIDAMSFFEAGFSSSISVPNGASKGNQKLDYLGNCWDSFADCTKIYLAMDADEAGQSLMHELARRLGRERCLIVRYPDDCKDANEVLCKHGVNVLKDCVANAEPFPIEGVITMREVQDDVVNLYNKGAERGLEVGLGAFDRLCTFKTSMLYTFTGIPTHGKSTFVEWLATLLSTSHGWKFGIFSPEHYPLQYHIYRLAEMIVGKPFFEGDNERMSMTELQSAVDFIQQHYFFVRPEGESFSLDSVLEVGRMLTLRHGIKGFIIDPWNTIQHDFGSMSETQYIERSLNKLTAFKQANDLAVFLIAHPKKMTKDPQTGMYEVPTMYDISGSSNFYNKTDFGISIYRNFQNESTQIYVQKCKFKNLGMIDYCSMRFNKLNNRFDPLGEGQIMGNQVPEMEQGSMEFDDDVRLPYSDNDELIFDV